MKYIRFTILTKDQHLYEYARAYRNGAKMPPCPYHWNIINDKTLDHISSEFCTYAEKYRIARRGDQRMLRDIIDRLELVNGCA